MKFETRAVNALAWWLEVLYEGLKRPWNVLHCVQMRNLSGHLCREWKGLEHGASPSGEVDVLCRRWKVELISPQSWRRTVEGTPRNCSATFLGMTRPS